MLNHLGSKPIKTDRLLLRPFNKEDASKIYHNWAKDPEVTRYLTWQAHKDVNETMAVLQVWLDSYENMDYYHWCIEYEGEPVGGIGLANISDQNHNAQLGYCLGRAYWSKGIMTEALQGVLDFMFTQVGFNKLSAYHDTKNPASGRVMEKVGMKEEGLLKQEKYKHAGYYADMRLLAILREDWLTARNI